MKLWNVRFFLLYNFVQLLLSLKGSKIHFSSNVLERRRNIYLDANTYDGMGWTLVYLGSVLHWIKANIIQMLTLYKIHTWYMLESVDVNLFTAVY